MLGDGHGSRSDLKRPATTLPSGESRWLNVRSDFEVRPTDGIHFSLRQTVNPVLWDITQSSLVGGVEGRWGYVDLGWSLTRSTTDLEATGDEVSVTGEHWFYKNDRIRLGYDLTHDFSASAGEEPWLYRRVIASYFNQCLGLSLSWEDNALPGVRREQEWELLVTLRDLGNFLRYRRRGRGADGDL